MKKPKQRQPEGGVDIFKPKDIPKKPRQPEGSGAPKIKPKKKIVQKQPETISGKPVVKRKPTQPETISGKTVKKKITGSGEFADTNKLKKTNGKKTNGAKSKTPTSFGQAFAQARKKLGAGKTFTYKGKKYSTNRADDKKKKPNFLKTVKIAANKSKLNKSKTRT